MDAEVPIIKYTLHACALFFKIILDMASAAKVVSIWKINCAAELLAASSVSVSVSVASDVGKVYTPGGSVFPPRIADGSAAVGGIARALSPRQWVIFSGLV
jgi:hypothetical protein